MLVPEQVSEGKEEPDSSNLIECYLDLVFHLEHAPLQVLVPLFFLAGGKLFTLYSLCVTDEATALESKLFLRPVSSIFKRQCHEIFDPHFFVKLSPQDQNQEAKAASYSARYSR
jgi:hypothetical protein